MVVKSSLKKVGERSLAIYLMKTDPMPMWLKEGKRVHWVDKKDGRREEGLYTIDLGKDRSREKESISKAIKGKEILMHSRKNKSKYQKQGVGVGSIILEKRKVGEKVSESSEYDNLSSSDQDKGEQVLINRGRGKPKASVVKSHSIRTRQSRSREQRQIPQEDSEIELVDVAGKRLSWSLEEEITKVIETGVAIGAIKTR
ncbi:hypothetical protein Q3G72_001225 [Acer saccharum]|nr:hypothetical protein Q3G72_001225 [Acer saccharum]